MKLISLGIFLLLPVLSAQGTQERTRFEKLIPEQPFVEISIENPARLWKDLVKSRLGRVFTSGSMAELRKAWQQSFELDLLFAQIQSQLGLDRKAGSALFANLQKVDGSLRLAFMAEPGFGGWVLEIGAEASVLERLRKSLMGGFGDSPPVDGDRFSLLGQPTQVHKQKKGFWFFTSPIVTEGKLYFAAWKHPDGSKILAGKAGPWMQRGGRRIQRTLIQRNKMPFMLAVDLRDLMAWVQDQIREAEKGDRFHDEVLQLAKLLAWYEARSIGLAVDIKRGRIIQEVRAEVREGGRFAGFLGAVIPREGRAVDMMAFQAKGTRTSAFISVETHKVYAEFLRIFKEGSREFGGEEMDPEVICQGMFGFSLAEDLIEPLDGRVLFFEGEVANKTQKKRTGFCLGLGTKNPQKTGDVLLKLFAAGGFKKKPDLEFKGITIHEYDFSFLWSKQKLRYALTKGFFLFAFEEAGYDYMKQIIQSEQSAEESRFRPVGDLKSQLMLVPQESATLVWADTLLAATSLLEEWATGLDRVQPPREEGQDDPSSKVLKSLSETLIPLLKKEGLATTLSALGRDRHGFWIRWVW